MDVFEKKRPIVIIDGTWFRLPLNVTICVERPVVEPMYFFGEEEPWLPPIETWSLLTMSRANGWPLYRNPVYLIEQEVTQQGRLVMRVQRSKS